MKKLLLLALLLFPTSAFAQASTVTCNPTLTETAVLSSFADNVSGGITPRNLRDYVCSNASILTPVLTGGGVPLTGTQAVPVLGVPQFIPQTLPTTTAAPALTVQRSTNYSTGTTRSPTFYILTQPTFTLSAANAQGIYSELSITGDTVASPGEPFGEAISGNCFINSGVTNVPVCTGGTFGAIDTGGSTFGALFGVEGGVSNLNADAVAPNLFNPNSSIPTVAFSASTQGTKKLTAAYWVNPYETLGSPPFQVGFYCPQEVNVGTEVAYACFEGATHATYGIDLSLGTWTTASINTSGFTVLGAGNTLMGETSLVTASNLVEINGTLGVLNGNGIRIYAAGNGQLATITHDTNEVTINWPFTPNANTAVSLGSSGLRWNTVFASQFSATGGNGVSCAAGTTSAATLAISGGIITHC